LENETGDHVSRDAYLEKSVWGEDRGEVTGPHTVKKRFAVFLSPAGMSVIKLWKNSGKLLTFFTVHKEKI